MNDARRIVFFSVAVLLATVGWLRPPLSPDINGLHISLGIIGSHSSADALLQAARSIPIDAAGILLLAVIGIGAVAVFRNRARFPAAAGAVLCAALAANAAVALNHPLLMERLDAEREQRQQLVSVLRQAPDADPLSTPTNGRISGTTFEAATDPVFGSLVRPADYLFFGQWLVGWAALGLWFGTPGRIARWKHLGGWTAAGVVVAFAICAPRLRAEYHWASANRYERRGDLAAARRSLDAAKAATPELGSTQRAWMLTGKLDVLEGQSTPAAAMYRASQLASLGGPTEDPDRDTPDLDRLRRAAAIIEPALVADFDGRDVASRLAARIHTELGATLFGRNPLFTDSGLDYRNQDRGLVAARDAWSRAAELDAGRLDAPIYLSIAETLLDPFHPERAAHAAGIADRMLHADVLNLLGDAYFAAGRMPEARRHYAESLDLLNLPQRKNFRAQRGLGGL